MKDLVISYPVIVEYTAIRDKIIDLDSNEPGMVGGADAGRERGGGIGMRPEAGGEGNDAPVLKRFRLKRIDFTVQFCWQPKTPSERKKEN